MTVFNRLFSGRPLAAKLGIAGAMMLLLVVAAIMLPKPGAYHALASTDGVVLSYDLSSQPDAEAAVHQFKDLEKSLQAGLPEGVTLDVAGRIEVRKERRVIKHGGVEQGAPEETETKITRADILISNADDATVEKVKQQVAAAIPGVPQPTVKDATWFRDNDKDIKGGINISLRLNGEEHVFNFPKGTSAEQIKSEIKQWVEQKHPGMDFNVDVQMSGDGATQQQIEVKIESKDEEQK